MFLLNTAFTVTVLFIFYKIGTKPNNIDCFAVWFTTVELWALAGIKEGRNRRAKR